MHDESRTVLMKEVRSAIVHRGGKYGSSAKIY